MTDEASSESRDRPPSRAPHLTYDQVDLVLRRAAEIEHGRGQQSGDGGISTQELERLGNEIGLSRDAVRMALVEMRTNALAQTNTQPGVIDRWFAPSRAVVARTVHGPVEQVREHVQSYMRDQLFRVKRNFGERLVWEPAEGVLHSVRRALDFSKQYRLSTGCEIESHVLEGALSADAVEVRFVVDMKTQRNQAFGGSAAVGTVLAGAGALVGGLAFEAAMSLIPVASGFALAGATVAGTRYSYRNALKRQCEALERFLDFLEHERDNP